MSGEYDRDIKASNLQFENSAQFTFGLGTIPEVVDESVKELKTGRYRGWVYIKGPTIFVIPITLSTDPKIVQAITVVIIGILLAIAFWEVYFYFSAQTKRNNSRNKRNMAQELSQTLVPVGEIEERIRNRNMSREEVDRIQQNNNRINAAIQNLIQEADNNVTSAIKIESRTWTTQLKYLQQM